MPLAYLEIEAVSASSDALLKGGVRSAYHIPPTMDRPTRAVRVAGIAAMRAAIGESIKQCLIQLEQFSDQDVPHELVIHHPATLTERLKTLCIRIDDAGEIFAMFKPINEGPSLDQ